MWENWCGKGERRAVFSSFLARIYDMCLLLLLLRWAVFRQLCLKKQQKCNEERNMYYIGR